MGLDIHLQAENYDDLYADGDSDDNQSLSRTFCNFMSRRDVVADEPELDKSEK